MPLWCVYGSTLILAVLDMLSSYICFILCGVVCFIKIKFSLIWSACILLWLLSIPFICSVCLSRLYLYHIFDHTPYSNLRGVAFRTLRSLLGQGFSRSTENNRLTGVYELMLKKCTDSGSPGLFDFPVCTGWMINEWVAFCYQLILSTWLTWRLCWWYHDVCVCVCVCVCMV